MEKKTKKLVILMFFLLFLTLYFSYSNVVSGKESDKILKVDKTTINDFSVDTVCTENYKTSCRVDCLDWSLNNKTNKTICTGGYGETCKNISLSKSCIRTFYSGIKYYNNGSSFLPINTTVVRKNCDYDYCVKDGVYKADFKIFFNSSNPQDLVKFFYNGTYITFRPDGLYYSGNEKESLISQGKNVGGYPINNTFYYFNLYGKGLDLKYGYYETILKEGLVIKNNSTLPIPDESLGDNPSLSLRFVVKNNGKTYEDNEEVKVIGKGKSSKEISEKIDIKNSLNEDIFSMITPYAIDSNNSKIKLNYTIESEGGDLIVSIDTPYEWLKNAVYPVEIDPSITLANGYLTDDAFTSLGSPDTPLGNTWDDQEITVGVRRTQGNNEKGWLKFDISSNLSTIGTGTITGYNLSLTPSSTWSAGNDTQCPRGGPTDGIYENYTIALSNSSWREKNITWNNSPPINTSVNSSTKYNFEQIQANFGDEIDFVVTNLVNNNTELGNLSFTIVAVNIGWHGIWDCMESVSFYSKDTISSNHGAKLKILYEETYNLTSCSDLNVDGMTYYLDNDILNSQIDKCMRITEDNIKLDCQGHKIESDAGATDYGIYIESGLKNITIFNCSLNNWDTVSIYANSTDGFNLSSSNISANPNWQFNARWGVLLQNMNNSIIENNIFHDLPGFYQEGIDFSGDNSNITNNVAHLTTWGVSFSGDNNIISNNFIYDTYDLYGLSAQGDSCTIYNNTISNTAGEWGDSQGLSLILSNSSIYNNNISGGYTGVMLYGSDNHIFNNTINNFTDNLIYLSGYLNSSGNTINNNNLNCNGSGSAIVLYNSASSHGNITDNIFYDMNIIGNCSKSIQMNEGNATFLNVTYSAPAEIDGGNLFRKWYLDSQVNDTLGNKLQGINITAYRSSSEIDNSSITDSNGFLRMPVTEYIENNLSGKIYVTPTTINLTSNSYYTNSTVFNFTILTNTYQQFILENDTTPPSIIIDGFDISPGSKNFNFNITVTDTKISSCMYSIINSVGGVDGIANISFACNSTSVSAVTSTFGDFSLIVYANDTAGNGNSSTKDFLTYISSSKGSGSGNYLSISIEKVPVIAIKSIGETDTYGKLNRSILFARINSYCSQIEERQTFAVVDYSGKCSLTKNDVETIRENLSNEGVEISIDNLILFYDLFSDKTVEQSYFSLAEVDKYDLFTSILGITNELTINPPRLDRPFILLSSNTNKTIEYIFTVNKDVKECAILSGEGFSCEMMTNSSIKLKIKLNNTDFFDKVLQGEMIVTSLSGKDTTEVKRVYLVPRIYNFSYRVIGIPVTVILIFVLIILLALSIFFVARNKLKGEIKERRGKRIWKRN